MVLKEGVVIESGNFKLLKPINSIDRLNELMQTKKSIFFRHKMYSVAFLQNQQFRLIISHVSAGWFWDTEDLRTKEKSIKHYNYKNK